MLSSNNWKEQIRKQEPKKQRPTLKKVNGRRCFGLDWVHFYGNRSISEHDNGNGQQSS